MFALSSPRFLWSAFAILVVGVACAVVFLGFPTAQGARTHTVAVQSGGFVPSELTIVAGDTVVFRNESGSESWPASDPHPTHEYLDGFDPGKALAAGEEWAYTFTEPGSWRFHDHLSPSAHGEITVLGENGRSAVRSSDECGGQCFDELVRDAVENEGIDAAYKLFQDTYEAGELPRTCHWTAHQIGEAAYEMYREGHTFTLSHATTFCGFGFYHGFLEGLLREDPSPTRALEFCNSVETELGELGLQNCYHGIGHGYTEDPPAKAVEGSFEKMIAPGVDMCEYLFGKQFTNLNLCLTGVFTVPAGFAAKNEYGLTLDPTQPFAHCEGLPERYLKACYGEFAPKMDVLLDWDVTRIPAYLRDIDDDRLRRLVIWVVPSVMMAKHVQDENLDQFINGCRSSFSGNNQRICWGGALFGIFSHGQPERQYVQMLNFCASDAWRGGDEKRFCYGEAFRQMRMQYRESLVREACTEAPSSYRALCFDEAREHESPYDDPSFE